MEFHPEVLGLKKGDIVGVQLLVCPHGWEYVGPREGWRRGGCPRRENYPMSISRLSNRIDFVYSGNPYLSILAGTLGLGTLVLVGIAFKKKLAR